jgi:5'-3' exonuclease
MGFSNVFKYEGFEADDIIAQTVDFSDVKDMCIMITRDSDMYQLLAPNVMLYDHVKNKFYTDDDFKNDFLGIDPSQWVVVKAIAGCATDNVKGLAGIGEKTVVKMLAGQLGAHTQAYKAIMSNTEFAQSNVKLVRLPHSQMEIVPPIRLDDKLNMRAFAEICNMFGMTSFLRDSEWQRWKEAFGEG